MTTLERDIRQLTLLQATKFLRAYLECSDAIQAHIRELLPIVNDPNTDADDREMSLATLADLLFPDSESPLGVDLEESEKLDAACSNETHSIIENLDREEQLFADRLRVAIESKGLTQLELADKLGIGQPAISNMLTRRCRPQRKTIIRLADILSVSPEDLWPGFGNE
jgi:lambda repressor-like predicted transcriptional regulator